MTDPRVAFDRKILYSVAEVAEITGCPPGRVRRWIHRRQLEAVGLEDVPLVPLGALLARLERIEATRARRARLREERRAARAADPARAAPVPALPESGSAG